MIFVCGIHGVGKTFFCKGLSKKLGKCHYSASSLILGWNKNNECGKAVSDIALNQKILIEEVNKIKEQGIDFILDGHLCLLNENGKINAIDSKIIRQLDIEQLIVLIDKPKLIKKRLQERDGEVWDEDFINKFQSKEIEYAIQIGKKLGIDYQIISNQLSTTEKFGTSIVLPVNPMYVDKILSGEKKYEYRKTLCKENIDKIYLYATAPVKKIIGECMVEAKYSMKKEKMWNLTMKSSGISLEYYENYFSKTDMASAYVLGDYVKYDTPLELKDFGINYILQSYSYVKHISSDYNTIENSNK